MAWGRREPSTEGPPPKLAESPGQALPLRGLVAQWREAGAPGGEEEPALAAAGPEPTAEGGAGPAPAAAAGRGPVPRIGSTSSAGSPPGRSLKAAGPPSQESPDDAERNEQLVQAFARSEAEDGRRAEPGAPRDARRPADLQGRRAIQQAEARAVADDEAKAEAKRVHEARRAKAEEELRRQEALLRGEDPDPDAVSVPTARPDGSPLPPLPPAAAGRVASAEGAGRRLARSGPATEGCRRCRTPRALGPTAPRAATRLRRPPPRPQPARRASSGAARLCSVSACLCVSPSCVTLWGLSFPLASAWASLWSPSLWSMGPLSPPLSLFVSLSLSPSRSLSLDPRSRSHLDLRIALL
ncbi:unnamed protein product [Prorocentrum cordatum]|uniref:Uncharacterized protein n=1 Tax=Prorocentrum cordatum TaxID=2364126 RepID=A0ABN9QD01_9DINO|nr:unnamed protein product [Polarella glacialis]